MTKAKVIQLCGRLPSTERRKCRPLATTSKCCGNRQTDPYQKLARPLAAKFEIEPPFFLQPFYRPLGLLYNNFDSESETACFYTSANITCSPVSV